MWKWSPPVACLCQKACTKQLSASVRCHAPCLRIFNIRTISQSCQMLDKTGRRSTKTRNESYFRKASFVKQWNYENRMLFGQIKSTYTKPPKRDPDDLFCVTERVVLSAVNDRLVDEPVKTDEKHKSKKTKEKAITKKKTVKKKKKPENDLSAGLVEGVGSSRVDSQSDPSGLSSVNETNLYDSSSSDLNSANNEAQKSELPKTGTAISIDGLESILMFPMFTCNPSAHPYLSDWNILSKVDGFGRGGQYAEKFPSVSTIMNKTMPAQSAMMLNLWRKRMIAELGEEGFRLMNQATKDKGVKLHACIEEVLHGKHAEEVKVSSEVEGHWQSLEHVFPDISHIQLIEGRTLHPYLHYSGRFDCVASYKGKACLIDWKSSKRLKQSLSSTYDNPLQIAAYLGAVQFDTALQHQLQVENGLIVVAYEDGTPAHAHTLSRQQCTHFWGQWLSRLNQYWREVLTEPGKPNPLPWN